MKKRLKPCLLYFILVLFFSCSSLPKESLNEWNYSADKTVGVLAKKEGIEIKINHSTKYKDIEIHVENITNPEKENKSLFYIKADEKRNEYIYPFVKKGEKYRVYVILREKSNSKEIKSKNVEIIAIDGKGEISLDTKNLEKKYNSSNFEVIIEGLKINLPKNAEILPLKGYICKKNESIYFDDFDFSSNKISLKKVIRHIRGKTFYLRLNYSFIVQTESISGTMGTALDSNNSSIGTMGTTFEQCLINNNENWFTDTNTEATKRVTGLTDVYLSTDSGKKITSKDDYVSGKMVIDNKEIKIKVKGRGNSSWGSMPKHSYNLNLEKKESFFRMKEEKKWVLVSNYVDKTLIRNIYTVFLSKKIFNNFEWTPDFKQINLYINGEYSGTYLFGERISINKNRINIQSISKPKVDLNKDKKTDIKDGGFILEVNRREDEEFNFRTKGDVSISLKEPEKVDKESKKLIKEIIQKVEDSILDEKNTDEYKKLIDVNSFVDWYLINEFNKNVDSGWYSSIYMYFNPKDRKLHIGPLWDYDLAFGNVNYNDCDKPQGFYIKTKNIWFQALLKKSDFRKLVYKRWNQKKAALKDSIEKQIDKLALEVKESSYYNFERWPILGEYVWPNADGYEKRKSFESEVKYLKDWCIERFKWMDQEIQKFNE